MNESPYPGLRPFFEHESDIFFGREEQVEHLLKKLAKSRFLAVIGRSGCGKSSLVRAGMLPALKAGFLFEKGAKWRTITMRPGNRPILKTSFATARNMMLMKPGHLWRY